MEFELTDQERSVCKLIQCAIDDRRGICDINDFNDENEKALLSLEEKGYIRNDVNCIVLKEEFKDFLKKECGKVGI